VVGHYLNKVETMSKSKFLSYKEWLGKNSKHLPAYRKEKRSNEPQPPKQSKGCFYIIPIVMGSLILLAINAFLFAFLLFIVFVLFIISLVLRLFGFAISTITNSAQEEEIIHLDPFGRHILSGTPLMYYRDVDAKFTSLETGNDYFVNVAGLRCPANLLSRHLFLMGQSGSGKTLLLSLLLNSVAYRFKEQHKVRASG
jgi:hypothetical protein